MSDSMDGKKAEDFILDYLANKSKTIYVARFSDTYDANKGRWGNPLMKKVFLKRKPSDAVVTINGITYYVEIKSTHSTKGITSGLFSQQKGERIRIENAGGYYVYLIYSFHTQKWYWVFSTQLKENSKWSEMEKFFIDFPKVP